MGESALVRGAVGIPCADVAAEKKVAFNVQRGDGMRIEPSELDERLWRVIELPLTAAT